ncbi:hypothetical protein [Actinoplanes sp. L3-i22]|uniref:hypothetical protein n=1 Tax=Actinoplanes sp. L3-i22 TaxID=2836373 RepID=UPI0021055013|nr:hypothetical protein [Actinoplanes sp. L3-i22]
MRSSVDGDPRLTAWQRVREFAVPPAMIETATARRLAGDWAGACAAARVDPDLDPRAIAFLHGHAVAAAVRDDLRHFVPELLRWHLPRVESGRLRPGVTVSLARYGPRLHLVARTAPAWADADQRISLALWGGGSDGVHPHPRPNRRFRFDLHRHLWDVRCVADLRERAGVATWAGDSAAAEHRWPAEADILRQAENKNDEPVFVRMNTHAYRELRPSSPAGHDGRPGAQDGTFRGGEGGLTGSFRVVEGVPGTSFRGGEGDGGESFRGREDGRGWPGGRAGSTGERGNVRGVPRGSLVLPDAATWVLPDLELLRAGLIEAGQLHPLVADALVPPRAGAAGDIPGPAVPERISGSRGVPGPAVPEQISISRGVSWLGVPERGPGGRDVDATGVRVVECRGRQHRIGLVDGVLSALDHDADELGREAILVAFGGAPLPCLRVIDNAMRSPETLADIRARLDHGDLPGAIRAVEALLGPHASLRDGPLRDELARVEERHLTYGLYRAGLAGFGPPRLKPVPRRRRRFTR